MPESGQNKNAFVINPLDTELCRYDEKQKRAAPNGAVNHFQEERVPRRIYLGNLMQEGVWAQFACLLACLRDGRKGKIHGVGF